jgi:CAS/CSE protein, C-terminus
MQIAPVATVALGELAKKLLEVCKNPMQPHFNHFLFESVAALIHFGKSETALRHHHYVLHWQCLASSTPAEIVCAHILQLSTAAGTAAKPDMLDTFQEQLFPAFQVVLQVRTAHLRAVWFWAHSHKLLSAVVQQKTYISSSCMLSCKHPVVLPAVCI